jgi:hemolysin activation/secretion protein
MPAWLRLTGVAMCLAACCGRLAGQGVETQPQMYIQEYEVAGVKHLPRLEVEKAVYPFLGPGRTADDVEHARAALEKAYKDRGYQTVSVQIPQQNASNGVVLLHVVETVVGRLRVHGSRYYDLDQIKKKAPSLAEGKLPDFNKINHDIIALNAQADLRVTPALRAGVRPGTVDIDLDVKDKQPLHGSLEVNNRHNNNTTPLRVNGSLRYDNLWQLGHSVGVSYQIAGAGE